jgi:hypothetical protein
MGFDEGGASSAFIFGTTTATADATGSLTITPIPIKVGGIIIGSADINEAELEILDGATVSTVELNRVVGVTSGIQTQIDSKLATAGGTMTGDLILGDNVKLEIGNATGGDLEIYHDGTNTYIDNNTGQLKINGDDIHFMNAADNETMLEMAANGNVVLYFDNDAKFATNSGGTATTGTHTATLFSGSGASLTAIPAAQVSGQLRADSNVTFDYDALPTADPGIKGRLWRSGTTDLQISAG